MHADLASLERIVFVLDGPREPANIGAVVRLLGNFGLTHLRLVEPPPFEDDGLLRFARRGERVVAAIERHPSLDSALADCGIVLGTTRRERALERPVLTPRQAAGTLMSSDDASGDRALRAAVLFGPEDFGLSNTALGHCHAIVTIPTVPDDASLNLAQAAVVVAYELFLAASGGTLPAPIAMPPVPGSGERIAAAAELEALFYACRHMLTALYEPSIQGRTNAAVARLRAFFMRGVPREQEARLLTTIFEHVARKLGDRQ